VLVFMIHGNYNTVFFLCGSNTVYKFLLAFFLNITVKRVINLQSVYAGVCLDEMLCSLVKTGRFLFFS
jgi:hypothetical protein